MHLKTLDRGLNVLAVLAEGGPAPLVAICEATDIERSAMYRILRTLETTGFVRRTEGGEYALTLRLWELGAAGLQGGDIGRLRAVASPVIRQLAADIGETALLAVYDAGESIYLDIADGHNPIRSYTRLGARAPAYCVATGKAMLAHLGRSEMHRVVAAGLQAHTDRTFATAEALRRELEGIRGCGYSVNHGEWRAEVGGVAVPILDHESRAMASLGVSGPCERIVARSPELGAVLLEAAARIRRELGAEPSEPRPTRRQGRATVHQ